MIKDFQCLVCEVHMCKYIYYHKKLLKINEKGFDINRFRLVRKLA